LTIHTGSHSDVERFAYESKQRSAEVDRFIGGHRHIHADQFL